MRISSPTRKKFAAFFSALRLALARLPSQKSSCNVKCMQSDCHRCGHPIEGQLTFCPACGAPQIRVSRAIETSQEETTASDSDLPAPSLPVSALPSELSTTAGIDWRYFLRTAIPLAALTDVLTVTLHPLALFVFLPANLVWAISRYRRHRPIAIRSGQGARMGAMMGLLSFDLLSGLLPGRSFFPADPVSRPDGQPDPSDFRSESRSPGATDVAMVCHS